VVLSSNAQTSAKYRLSTDWWNELALRGHDFFQGFNICNSKYEGTIAPLPLGYAPGNSHW